LGDSKKREKARHVHIGTGKFGLGFVGYFSHRLGFATSLLNRAHENSSARNKKLHDHRKYRIKYFDQESRQELIQFEDCTSISSGQETSGRAVELISDPKTKLLTTSVGESHLKNLAPIIASGLQARTSDTPLFIIACENGHRCSSKILEKWVVDLLPSSTRKETFIDCVVDQVCEEIEEHKSSKDIITVSVESHREWIIESEDEELQKLLKHSFIKFVPSGQIDIYETRKLWLVNGFQLALAVLGMEFLRNSKAPLSEVIKSDNKPLSDQVNGIRRELENALHIKDQRDFFKRQEINSFANQVTERIRQSQDTCERILRDALFGEERIRQVTRDFGMKLGEGKALPEVFADSLYECIFQFLHKAKDRLYDPADILLSNNQSAGFLGYIIQRLVPFLLQEGDKLRPRK
jgi:mannitol-1-phosphate/altronate dehydrogenase